MVTDGQLNRFALLFQGYDKYYGWYNVAKGVQAGTKAEGKRGTRQGSITPDLWREHLDGTTGTGLGVIMLQGNDTCRFAAIDIDDYKTDHTKLCALVKKLGLPLVVCRTKSGGAHLYAFFKEDVPATDVRDRLAEWVAVMGLAKNTEQFPKQINRANEDEIGNWINIPYQNAELTMRYALIDGKALELEAFLDHAEKSQVGRDYMSKPFFAEQAEDDLFFEGPPCLVTIQNAGGFVEGSRNTGMFSVGVYLRKRYGDEWPEHFKKYNAQMANLPDMEILAIIKNVNKKGAYTYPCTKPPINSVCQRRACLKREFGISDGKGGGDSKPVELYGVIRYDHPEDPPLWSFEINEKRVMVDNDTFYSRDALNRACMAQAGCVPFHMSSAKWLVQLNEIVQSADIVPMPSDAGPTGQLWERIEMFLQQGVNALHREEVLTGKVFRDGGLAYFRSLDLFAYLDARRVKYKNEQFVWQLLKKHKAEKETWEFGRKEKQYKANVWVLPYTAEISDVQGEDPVFGKMDEF